MILIEQPRPLIPIGRGFSLVACFESASGLIRPVPARWVLSVFEGYCPNLNLAVS
jgi:hypothetical protein